MIFEAEVMESIQRTRDILSIRFARPEEFEFEPGQFIFLSIGSSDNELTKHLSISSSPTEGILEVTKRLTGHPFPNALASLKKGDKIKLRGPYGKFIFQDEHKKIGMLSGGIGITPLRSIIKYINDKMLDTDVVLIYSNRHEDDIAFEQEFDEIMAKNPKFNIINTITNPGSSWTGTIGRISADMIKQHIPDYLERVFYISGPTKMVESMVALLLELGIPEDQIKKELFTGYD